ncbi:MAG: hypothetical protein N2596_03800 [Syntrophorhabdaceae bacterium]|nr:hypothetical protein [Syntrophorhabdaceae bacterium]
MKRYLMFFLTVFISACVIACQSYKTQVVPFKLPSAYPNMINVSGADIAARVFDNKEEAENAFGFDIIGAGVLPVQVIFDNKGPHRLQIVSNQTFLVDVEDNLWPVLDSSIAYERIHSKTKYGPVASEGTKGAVLAGIAGSAIGAAIGIITGQNVLESAGKGAALGAAAGLTMGGAKGLSDQEAKDMIRKDLQARNLKNKPINQGEVAHGFVFFPGESKKPKELRIQIKEEDTGILKQITFKL